uniref:Uncharacterized protein n=1 Tax=Electrophorus electricus TaxID=8005 RepID=A0AAY5ECR8_ELEEL
MGHGLTLFCVCQKASLITHGSWPNTVQPALYSSSVMRSSACTGSKFPPLFSCIGLEASVVTSSHELTIPNDVSLQTHIR